MRQNRRHLNFIFIRYVPSGVGRLARYIHVMGTRRHSFKCIVTALALTFASATALPAQETALDGLYQELFEADDATHMRIAERITNQWKRSGSAAMDLLLRRGTEALEDDDPAIAIEHLTALVDHAPEFAEGYHARASAFYALGLLGPAIDDLRQTLILNPRHFDAMFGIGILMEELNRPEDAAEVYQTILNRYPLNPEATGRLEQLDVVQGGQSL